LIDGSSVRSTSGPGTVVYDIATPSGLSGSVAHVTRISRLYIIDDHGVVKPTIIRGRTPCITIVPVDWSIVTIPVAKSAAVEEWIVISVPVGPEAKPETYTNRKPWSPRAVKGAVWSIESPVGKRVVNTIIRPVQRVKDSPLVIEWVGPEYIVKIPVIPGTDVSLGSRVIAQIIVYRLIKIFLVIILDIVFVLSIIILR
jgi:hypothetical protein